MSSGSQHQLAFIAEVTAGTTPATPAFQNLRHKSCGLKINKNTLQSEEIRSDRQISDLRHAAKSAAGSIAGELSYSTYDALFEAALGGSWAANVLEVGTTRRFFTFERFFADIGEYQRFTGCEINTMTLTVSPDAMAQVSFDVVGRGMTTGQAAIAGATYGAETTTSPFDGFTASSLQEGGASSAIITEISLTLENAVEPQFAIGSTEAAKMSQGRSNLTGSITAFFENATLLDKWLNETESSLQFQLNDGSNTLLFEIPRIKYTDGDVPAEGEGEIFVTMPFQALYDAGEGTNFRITR